MNRFTKTIAAVMLIVAAIIVAGCNKPDEPKNVSGNFNGHDYVDLNLPSGTLWATCNVGASIPEGYGDYFAWGETEPKDFYGWSNYKYCKDDWNRLIKYCSSSIFGYLHFIDDLTVLEDVDDAATAKWGSGWYMPTEAQWEELLQNTSSTWTTQNGVNGRLFTGSNGYTLFLPAAGNRWESEMNGIGTFGNCWSSSLFLRSPNGAKFLVFGEDRSYVFYDARCKGGSVRAVHPTK